MINEKSPQEEIEELKIQLSNYRKENRILKERCESYEDRIEHFAIERERLSKDLLKFESLELEQKQYDIVLYDWDEAIRRKPLQAGYVVSKADVLISLYRMAEAREELNAAIKRGVPRYALKEWLDKCRH